MVVTSNKANLIDFPGARVACRDCSMFRLCLPLGMGEPDLQLFDRIIKRHRPVRKGTDLFRMGERFGAIYAVRSGCLKTYMPTPEGGEQVIGFHLPGELVGLDAITEGYHPCSAKALQSTSVCKIPFRRLENLGEQVPNVRQQLVRLLSRAIRDDERFVTLLGKKTALQRLAALLMSFSARFRERGFSPLEFRLSMSRFDIANYLGLDAATVSRLFTRLQREGAVEVARRHIRIRNLDQLADLAELSAD